MSHISDGLDESDTDSLPDLSDVIPRPPADRSKISKGDIVWAKFKNLYWPALVRCVYNKDKKISVWYTDEPGKTFKLPLKNVCSFHDVEMRIKIENDVKEAGCAKEHEGLTSHALRYLKRKALGHVVDPRKFFDQTYPFYLMEDFLEKNPDADDGIKIPPLYISHEKKNIRKSLNFQTTAAPAVETDIESVSSDGESNPVDETNDHLTKVVQEISSVSNKSEYVNEIVEFIKLGKADDYLEKIHSKRIPSDYHDIYEREIKCHKKSRTHVTYTGPIENDEKLREIIFYLLPLYNNMINAPKCKRYSTRSCKVKVLEYPSSDKKSVSAQYVASVWLPEAIIYAMSDVYNISLTDAKQLFKKKSEFESKDIENIFASPGSEATTSNSDIIKQKLTTQEHDENNIGICSPLKKLCVGRFVKYNTINKS